MDGTSGLSTPRRARPSDRFVKSRRVQAALALGDARHADLWIDPEYEPVLARLGLASFEQLMGTSAGRQLRALKDRENWRLDLALASGHRGAYLKKHHIRTWGTRLRALLGRGPGNSAGRVEAENIARLDRGGVPAMRLIAFGERLQANGRLESLLLTEELTGYVQLDHLLRERFTPTRARSRDQEHHLRILCRKVADLARRFHALGFNHRDFYCCHFFIRESRPGAFQVNLIDLQRVEHRQRFRRRWIVKDLAQLAYSAPREFITCSQKLRFMMQYLGIRKLRPADKRLIRRVVAKQRIMEWQVGKNS